MPFVLWDASGLIKRYVGEPGAEAVEAVFAQVAISEMGISPWGYLETYSILQRRHHSGLLDYNALKNTVTALQTDVIFSGDFHLLHINDSAIFAAASLIDKHHINSADAAILSAYLRFQVQMPMSLASCLLVAADKRLIRAAEAEGLKTLNPELLAAADVPAFLAGV